MRFSAFKSKCKLVEKRFIKLLDSSKSLSESDIIDSKLIQKAKLLYEEAQAKNSEVVTSINEVLNDEDSEIDENELAEITSNLSDMYMEIGMLLKPIIDGCLQNENVSMENVGLGLSTSQGLTSNSNQIQSHIRLPKLQLKNFNGDISNWTSYYNLFETSVNTNESLSNVEKFQFLLSTLEDEPLNLVKSLPLTSENYKIAYDIVVKRYHNPRLLKSVHINYLLDIPQCTDSNAKSLRNFLSKFNEHSSALTAIDPDLSIDNPFLATNLFRKFSHSLITRFESSRTNTRDFPTTTEFLDFLENECVVAENAILSQDYLKPTTKQTSNSNSDASKLSRLNSQQNFRPNLRSKFQSSHSAPRSYVSNATQSSCLYCNESHTIYTCTKFASLTIKERRDFIQSKKACFNCLSPGHMMYKCISRSTCKTCSKHHHSLLHDPAYQVGQDKQTNVSLNPQIKPNDSTLPSNEPNLQLMAGTSSQNSKTNCTVLLSTAVIHVRNSAGEFHTLRALLDQGSQASFITEKAANKLNLKRQRCNQSVTGLSQTTVPTSRGIVDIVIKPCFQKGPQLMSQAIVLPNISAPLPSVKLSSDIKTQFQDFPLADPHFDEPAEVDVLLGADLCSEIFDGGRHQSPPGYPTLFHSIFGWVIIGKTTLGLCHDYHSSLACNFIKSNSETLEGSLQRFWEMEEPNKHLVITSPEEEYCEELFKRNHTRNATGRFVVSLPFKEESNILGDSFSTALKCLKYVERNMIKNPSLEDKYKKFMSEYEELGHMRKLQTHEPAPKYFLPHHAVFKDPSTESKIRVVFNASAKTTAGTSLNDVLLAGPKLQNDVRDILHRFRLFPIVFVTDICMMYRQIYMDPLDQQYQAILWRSNENEPIDTYLLQTVTYGVTSSPYLALRTLKQLATDETDKYPKAAEVLVRDSFVDDILTGGDSIEEALLLRNELIQLLLAGGFELKKWASNCSQLLSEIPTENIEIPINLEFPESKSSLKVLGVKWLPSTDVFTYQVNLETNVSVTKRNILSVIARLFDPLGWISPVIFLAKCIMQTLWKIGTDWDAPTPNEISHTWLKFVDQLKVLDNVKVPRFILPQSKISSIQLHGFCDASLKGYAAAIYVRCEDVSGNVTVKLVTAKSKVAPVKLMTVPRLELCGALLLSKLFKSYKESVVCIKLNDSKIFAWSDSMVTLGWIQTPPYKLKTFVANRVIEIQDNLSSCDWNYIPSHCNPADCGSRGLLPNELIEHSLWWQGPDWLYYEASQWPTQQTSYISDLPELKPEIVSNASTEVKPDLDLLERYSTFTRLQRVTAFILRFIHNSQTNNQKKTGPLTVQELNNALLILIRQTQKSYFCLELEKLKKNLPCSPNIQRLNPYLDEHGILRVGGRLTNSSLSYESRHQILLPKNGHLVELIIDFFHVTYFHIGPRSLQSLIQRKYWILSARNAIRKRLHKCVTCARFKSKTPTPFMADLPTVRTTPARPFQSIGVDFGGPFLIKTDRLRKPQIRKAYLCLFVCLATKALHLELVSDLSTNAFLAALDRLIARRGICTNIYSDRGTTFKGANNELKKLINSQPSTETISDHLSVKGINWIFNPPYAPNFGGIWEAGIKSVKYHLKRAVGSQVMTFEELATLFIQIEAILNSRPLCPLSTDPNEFDVLTPAHLLIGEPLTSIPYLDMTDIANNKLSRWQLIQKCKQSFWKRWSNEYLNTLQQREKWTIKTPEVKVGDIVLVKELQLPPQCWKIARVVETMPGSNNVTRVVKLKTASGTITRPVSKICPLPIN